MKEGSPIEVVESTLIELVNSQVEERERILQLYALLRYLFHVLGEEAGLHFATLFARIAHFGLLHKLDVDLIKGLHQFRIDATAHLEGEQVTAPDKQKVVSNGIFVIASMLDVLNTDGNVLDDIRATREVRLTLKTENIRTAHKFRRHVRFIAIETTDEQCELLGIIEPEGEWGTLAFGDIGRSDLYQKNVEDAIRVSGLPLTMSLVDVEYDHKNRMSPRFIVLEPDYLIDVTTVAECFQPSGADGRLAVIKSFMPHQWSEPLLLGAIANFFLDELIKHPDVEFDTLAPNIFKLQPVEVSLMSNEQIRGLLSRARKHFQTLKSVVLKQFPQLGIELTNTSIEPTFYTPIFGLQGRLDLYQHKTDSESLIVELKSGKPFRANTYGLSSNHYTQTLLYHLLLRSVSDFKDRPATYILYSGQETQPLRIAPVVVSIQREAVRLRNEIYLYQRQLGTISDMAGGFNEEKFPAVSGFLKRDVVRFQSAYQSLDALERAYFFTMNKLVVEEHRIAKLGRENGRQGKAMSSLWLMSDEEKEAEFRILRDLTIDSSSLAVDASSLVLLKGNRTNPLANFRVGDIAVLYPHVGGDRPSALATQVFKCTIIGLDSSVVKVKLRNDQVSMERFREYASWRLEGDLLDSSFTSMHKSLFRFMEFDPIRRALFLGKVAPRRNSTPQGIETVEDLVQRIVAAPDYFLLWGPPGTGKTSVILRDLVQRYLETPSQRILLLAYTNRAVDEICRAVESVVGSHSNAYLRIGSRVSSGAEFTDKLLSVQLDEISSRKNLISLLKSSRLVVSTVSSIQGSMNILDLLDIDTVIIDESSQILEPQLAGLLPRFKKVILIGDHRQLPAVVSQSEAETAVDKDVLFKIGLTNTRMSYFERMYTLATRLGWSHIKGELCVQGRMHTDIQAFASEHFYDGKLQVIDQATGRRDYFGPLDWGLGGSKLERALSTSRMLFMDVESGSERPWMKSNQKEAEHVTRLLSILNMIEPLPSIGVITPFRAQIAAIGQELHKAGIDPERFTIDTVERYQGSARDIIILSTVVSSRFQLDQIVSMSEDGIDRKLNVALTRAREQFILVGSRSALQSSPMYVNLMAYCSNAR